MASIDRVTLTLPAELLKEIDRREKNRSKFVAEAVRRELERRRRVDLLQSLQNPHPESLDLAEQEIDDWASGLPEEDVEELVNRQAGKPISWVAAQGWPEGDD